MPIALRGDFDAAGMRAAARDSKNAGQTRRLLALAAVYDGATRTEAARIGGVTLQIVRNWVMKLNAHGLHNGYSGCTSMAFSAPASSRRGRSPRCVPTCASVSGCWRPWWNA